MSTVAPREVVLLLTHSGDFYTVDRVAEALTRRGARPFRFNTDRFPAEVKLSARVEQKALRHVLEYKGEAISAEAVRAVWARKLWTPRPDESLDERFRAMCVRESVAGLEAFLDGLHAARWVNPIGRERAAENKHRQLRAAIDVGLRVPRTLITNSPEEARAFFAELQGRVVIKLLRPLTVSMGAAPLFLYTSDVREEDLRDAEMLRHSPVVFQERIEKARELRVVWVEGRAFVGAIDASSSTAGLTDWRQSTPGECPWLEDELPDETAGRLCALMLQLGLSFGAADIIRTPEGEHIFLEVNPAGEWGMLERDLGLPISEAIADALLR